MRDRRKDPNPKDLAEYSVILQNRFRFQVT
jgi:hypothetical protein